MIVKDLLLGGLGSLGGSGFSLGLGLGVVSLLLGLQGSLAALCLLGVGSLVSFLLGSLSGGLLGATLGGSNLLLALRCWREP